MMNNRIIPALLILLMISTAACGSSADTPPADALASSDAASISDAAQPTESPAGESDEAAAYPLTFENYGRTVTVTDKPQKALTLGPNCTEVFVALGLTDYIAGNSLKNHSRGPLPEYAADYERIPELNYGAATREAVISSGADFIYGLDWEFGGSGLDIVELEGYGMTVYVDSAATVEQTYQEILDIGKIFGIEDKAEAYTADQKSRMAAVQAKVAGKDAPKVLVYDSGNDGVFTASGANFESLLLGLAGGENLFGDLTEKAWLTVSYEEVLARVPDIILIHDYDAPSVEEKIAEMKANDMLSQLDCVKNERFGIIERESVLPGNRLAYTVEKLAKGFYPDLF
ncbi:MAG: ABC transporter substrate-binding protein [Clostridiales bacterium]|jgi:iron complex transport system substrate-binding protein|nr:ABC transporter substrate-binding protein [Clostridiales bacterium]